MAFTFTDKDYKYGSTYTYRGYNGGFPPALGNGRYVFDKIEDDNQAEFIAVASKAVKMMSKELGANRPRVAVDFRTPHYESFGVLFTLQLETYLMQEFLPNGETHPLYKAVTQESFKDFVAAFKAYEESNQTQA